MGKIRLKRHGLMLIASLSAVLTICALAHAQNWASQVQIEEADGHLYITSNGIPNHTPGQFPNNRNPNTIAPQHHEYRVSIDPKEAGRPTPVGMMPFGVALNGVPFDPSAAEWWNRNPRSGWQYEALTGFTNLGMDQHNAHVQPGGTYHYHGYPNGLANALYHGEEMTLLGYAADGFPIYAPYAYIDPNDPSRGTKQVRSSYKLKRGKRDSGPGGKHDGTFVEDFEYIKNYGDLDECNGRTGVTPEYPEGIYHYFITENFPFIPRYFRGVPDNSFKRRGPPPGRGGRGGRGPGGRRGHHPPPHHPPPHGPGGFPPPPRE
jgi:hypothetical protein